MRKPIVAGNWKMNKTTHEAGELATGIRQKLGALDGVDVVVCPPFTVLGAVAQALAGSRVGLGAQNMHWEKEGAFTGEVSAAMVRDAGCRYVILGHSERRTCFHETDGDVNRKTRAALAAGLTPIVCVGETLAERDGKRMEAVVTTQVQQSLAGLGDGLKRIVIAYEPVWAIGTGRTATPAQAQEAHALIRRVVAGMDAEVAPTVRIQYGGSVKPSNARELFSQPDIDGGLIGGASLDVASFVDIVNAAV